PKRLLIQLASGARLYDAAYLHVQPDAFREVAPLHESWLWPILGGREQACVQGDDSSKSVLPLGRHAEPDRTAPVLDDDRGLAKIQRLDERCDRSRMKVVRVIRYLQRLVGASETEVIRCDDAKGRCKQRDHLPVQVRPRRLAVKQQDRVAMSLIDVMHPHAFEFG